jgi:hypothetical protein
MVEENNNNQEGVNNPEPDSEDKEPQSGGSLVAKPERDETGKFISGHSKLGGVRKGYISPHRALNNKLQEIQEITIGDRKEQKAGAEILAEVLFKMAVSGNISAIREFFDRVEGRPKQIGAGEQPDEINLTQVFQQIFKESEEAKKQTDSGGDLGNKI